MVFSSFFGTGTHTHHLLRAIRCERGFLFGLLVFVLASCATGENEFPIQGTTVPYQGVWEYRYGACPKDSIGRSACLLENEPSIPFTVGPSESPPGRNGQNELWVRTKLIGKEYKDPVLLVRSIDQNYEAYVNGEVVAKSPGDFFSRKRYAGVSRAYVPLGPNYVGKTLVFRVHSDYWHIGVHHDQMLGERSAIMGKAIREGLSTIIVGSMLLLLALIGVVLWVIERRREIAFYSAFALSAGCYLLARSFLRIFLFGSQELARAVELSSLALMAAMLCGFVDSLFGSGPLKLLRYASRLFVAFFAISVLIVALGFLPMEWFLLPLQLVLLVMFGVMMANAIQIGARPSVDGRIMSVGMVVALVPTLYDLLATINVFHRYVVLTQYSIALFVLAVGIIIARRFIEARSAQTQLNTETAQARLRLAEQDRLLAAIKRVADGNLDAPIDVPKDSHFRSVADGLNRLREDVRERMQQLSARNSAAKQLNDELRRQIELRSRRLVELIVQRPPLNGKEAHLKLHSLLGEHYRIVCLLGTGATGVVVEVERITDGKHLAAKVLTKASDKVGVVRFFREAQILSRLDHPNLVSIKDVDVTDEGIPFLVMELVEGQTLRQLRSKYRNLRFALQVLKQMADALSEIHKCGIVHRDLRPSNVLVTDGGDAPVIKLFDFGVAALRGKEGTESGTYPRQKTSGSATSSSERVDVSSPGIVLGSPMYLAPECRKGANAVGTAADMFSLGVIAWELLTGELPFAHPLIETAGSATAVEIPRPHAKLPDVNPALEALLTNCLQPDPERRLTAQQVALELKLQLEDLAVSDFQPSDATPQNKTENKTENKTDRGPEFNNLGKGDSEVDTEMDPKTTNMAPDLEAGETDT